MTDLMSVRTLTMSPRSSSYRCNFCRENLRPVPTDLRQFVLGLFGARDFQCPHCFGVRLRPWGLLKCLTWPLWLVVRVLCRLLRI